MKYICSSTNPAITVCRHNKKKKLRYDIGVISAFALEQDGLIDFASKVFPPIDIGGRRYNRYIVHGQLVVSVISGVGMTNSAMTTQSLIGIFNPTYLFFVGIAGSLNSENQVGDVIINLRWLDIGSTKYIRSNLPYTNFVDSKPDYPMPMFRVCEQVVSLTWPSLDGIPDPTQPTIYPLITPKMSIPMATETLICPDAAYMNPVPTQFFFEPDEHLIAVARSAIRNITLNPIGTRISSAKLGDVGISSGTFLDNSAWRTDIVDQFRPTYTLESCDMETAAFAHTAVSNSKPFLAIRALSDLAGADPGAIGDYFAVAAQNSLIVFISIVSKLSAPICSKCLRKRRRPEG